MTVLAICVGVFILSAAASAAELPVILFSGGAAGACASGDSLDSYMHTVRDTIANALQDIANCPCGGSGR